MVVSIHDFGLFSMKLSLQDMIERTGQGDQDDMEEIDREPILWFEAHYSWPSRKEHLAIRCEIWYALATYLEGAIDVDDALAPAYKSKTWW